MYTYEVPRVHCDYTATGHVCVYMYVLYIYEVPRVHCDYTATGAPRRLVQLGREGIYSKLRHRTLTEEEVGELASGRYAFINVWRSIDEDAPVMQQPLAVCDEHSVADEVRSFVVHSYTRPCSLSPLRALVSSKYGDEANIVMSISTGPLPLRAAIPRPHRRELLAAAFSGAQVVLLQPAAQGGVPRLQGVRQEGRRAPLRLPHRLRRPGDARRRAAAQVNRGSRHRLL